MDDLENNDLEDQNDQETEKIPVIVMDQHHDAYKMIRRYIDEKNLLPKSGLTILHLDAHVDDLVPKDLQIHLQLEAKSTRFKLFKDIGTEVWLKTAVNDNVLKHVIWVKPPWALQTEDVHRVLENNVTLDIKTLGRSIWENVPEDYEGFKDLFTEYLSPDCPYILDLEYNFFSSDSPFTTDYSKAVDYYSKLTDIFELKVPENNSKEDIDKATSSRQEQLEILYEIFQHLENNSTLPPIGNVPSDLYQKVSDLQTYLLSFYSDEKIDWKSIYEAGVVSNDYVLPVHHTSREDIKKLLKCVEKVLDTIPFPPKLITLSIMYEYDRYTSLETLDYISDMLNEFFTNRYEHAEFEYLDY